MRGARRRRRRRPVVVAVTGPAAAPGFITIVIAGVAPSRFFRLQCAPRADRRSDGTMGRRRRKDGASGVGQPRSLEAAVLPRAAACPGAGEDHGLDVEVSRKWVDFRHKFPVRAVRPVMFTNKPRPRPGGQTAWHHYCQQRPGVVPRVQQEWWMPSFLVPFADKADVGVSPEEALYKAPGGQEEYTNIHRIRKLADEHPLVHRVLLRDTDKAQHKIVKNAIGRATKYHQSPWNLYLHVYNSVHITVGCTVNGAAGHLLSLWWRPEGKQKLNRKQEFLARAVFGDVVEGFHLPHWPQAPRPPPALSPATARRPELMPRWVPLPKDSEFFRLPHDPDPRFHPSTASATSPAASQAAARHLPPPPAAAPAALLPQVGDVEKRGRLHRHCRVSFLRK